MVKEFTIVHMNAPTANKPTWNQRLIDNVKKYIKVIIK